MYLTNLFKQYSSAHTHSNTTQIWTYRILPGAIPSAGIVHMTKLGMIFFQGFLGINDVEYIFDDQIKQQQSMFICLEGFWQYWEMFACIWV